VAGGFLRAYYGNEEASDLDIFFRSSALADAATRLARRTPGIRELAATDSAVTFQADGAPIPFQLITRVTSLTVDALLMRFDFTVCAAGLSFSCPIPTTSVLSGTVCLHDQFFEDLAARRLSFVVGADALTSLHRLFKYIQRGYRCPRATALQLAQNIGRRFQTDPDALQSFAEGLYDDVAFDA
jgi:hypothetical protein